MFDTSLSHHVLLGRHKKQESFMRMIWESDISKTYDYQRGLSASSSINSLPTSRRVLLGSLASLRDDNDVTYHRCESVAVT